MATVERGGLRWPDLRLPRPELPIGARIGLLFAVAAGLMLVLSQPEVAVLMRLAGQALGGLFLLALLAFLALAYLRGRAANPRIDAYIARKAEEHEAPVVEPMQRPDDAG